jgi:16S rRNA (cytosine967-C5)-methyltransferase
MAISRPQLDAATEALALALRFDRPADSVLHDFFRADHDLGARDRSFIADTVYGVLRRKRTVDHLAHDGGPRRMVLAYLGRIAGVSVRELAGATAPADQRWLAEIKADSLDALPLTVRLELPDWLVERLARTHSEAELIALARGLNEPAPLDLRVNSLRCERDEAHRILATDGMEAALTPYSPVGLRLQGRPSIQRHALFLEGAIEVQDEGSQILGYLVAPRRGELVVDFCAGAGGKSLMLGALMRSQGRLYAFDVSTARLNRLKPRLKRSGLSNLHPQPIADENDARIKRLAGKADRVLVDAPCTGLGTLRRNPDLKWRQSPQSLEEVRHKQASILRSAARLVKKGGRLVYATCSLLPEENEEIVSAFLSGHPEFRPLDCGTLLQEARIPLDSELFLKLYPHVHGTDGFFAAALVRK